MWDIFFSKGFQMKKDKITIKKAISFAIVFSMLISTFPTQSAFAEVPEKVYFGVNNARQIISNISFADVANLPLGYWARDSIYEAAALEAIKGFGDRNFRPSTTLSKEEAIALIYRMMGREADAQKAAEILQARRASNTKTNDAIKMWSDGYLQLAANDGLITQADLQVAMQRFQPKSGTRNRFIRADPAQRQEVATWVAKAMGLSPVYGQQNIFNSFNDWNKSDPLKIPYIEALLQRGIMNGKANGIFDPLGMVKREEMAKILKNMEQIALPLKKLEKKAGYIEGIFSDKDEKQGGGTVSTRLAVRGQDGKLYNIMTEASKDQLTPKGQEFNPGEKVTEEMELVVYKNGKLGTSSLLVAGDRIEYIVDQQGLVKYFNVTKETPYSKTIEGTIAGTDVINNTVSVEDENGNISTYKLNANSEIVSNDKPITLADVKNDRIVELVVVNDLVTRMKIKLPEAGIEKANIFGIVEENNPSLRYISLYDVDGASSDENLKIYNYNPALIQVQKNMVDAEISQIEAGDTVQMKTDENGEIVYIGATDNYQVSYGKILYKQSNSLGIEYNDGTQQVLEMASDCAIISAEKTITLSDLQDGDYIRMLVQKTPGITKIKQIKSQTYAGDISNIYKAQISGMDNLRKTVVLKYPEKLVKGLFRKNEYIGFLELKAGDGLMIYDDANKLSFNDAVELKIGKEAYIAVEKGLGNQEVAKMISFRNPDTKETLHSDNIISSDIGTGQVKLEGVSGGIGFSDGTIVVKDGRLVTARSLLKNDDVYVVTGKNPQNGNEDARIILAEKQQDITLALQLYRGKIRTIRANRDFTLQSYSILDHLKWDYTNANKTFEIGYNTRLVTSEGITSVREFVYGSDFQGSTVYVVADGTEALLISNAGYGTINIRGEVDSVTKITDESSDEAGTTTTLTITDATLYNADTGKWDDLATVTLNIPINTVIIRNDEVINASDIEAGDGIRVIKKDTTATGDAYIILIEN